MSSEFKVQIVTPERMFFQGEAELLIVKTTEGDLGIMKNHINYVAPLDIGTVKIKTQGMFKEAVISGGFVQIDKEITTILTEAAEWPHEIDLDRARAEKEEAEKLLEKLKGDAESPHKSLAEARYKKAINRIHAVEKKQD